FPPCFFPHLSSLISLFFFFTDTPTSSISTLSLHDALPISLPLLLIFAVSFSFGGCAYMSANGRREMAYHHYVAKQTKERRHAMADRKSTRLNSSHLGISYAVFCLKKKKNDRKNYSR